ncbi:MAG: CoxG family protein [Boseongicola sp.]
MDLSDEILVPASRETVYRALNDPDILKSCIPGCEELTKSSDTELQAKILLKIGPVKARFAGTVTLDPVGAPERFRLAGQGNGGAAGFAKGGAEVELEDRGDETLLKYTASADIGGKIAQLGSRLVQSTSKKLSAQFFQRFSEKVGDVKEI